MTDPDPDLRQLLHDAVADVEPTRTTDDVRAAEAPSRRGWVPLTVAAAVATSLILLGIPWLAGREGAAPPAAAPAAAQVPVVAYAVVDAPQGERLTPERRTVEDTGDPLEDAVRATLSDATADPDLDPVWPVVEAEPGAGIGIEVTDAGDGTVAIDLEQPADVTYDTAPADVPLLGQALAWTAATAVDDADVRVRLTIDGQAEDLRPDRSGSTLAPVTVESVGDGETVSSPFTVSGLATAFEGTVVWRLLDGEEVVREGFTTAQECCTPSPYSFEVDAPPADYVLEVSETDPSDGEGFPAYVATTRLTIQE